jgi:hypothetical protein
VVCDQSDVGQLIRVIHERLKELNAVLAEPARVLLRLAQHVLGEKQANQRGFDGHWVRLLVI